MPRHRQRPGLDELLAGPGRLAIFFDRLMEVRRQRTTSGQGAAYLT